MPDDGVSRFKAMLRLGLTPDQISAALHAFHYAGHQDARHHETVETWDALGRRAWQTWNRLGRPPATRYWSAPDGTQSQGTCDNDHEHIHIPRWEES